MAIIAAGTAFHALSYRQQFWIPMASTLFPLLSVRSGELLASFRADIDESTQLHKAYTAQGS